MIWWDDAEEHSDHPDKPWVKVLDKNSKENSRYMYLANSIGACFGGWETADPVNLATHILSIVVKMTVRDGVPGDLVQKELLKIDEYRDWSENEEGPFGDAHWRWSRERDE